VTVVATGIGTARRSTPIFSTSRAADEQLEPPSFLAR
jgi:hypothetical protein